MKSLKLKVATLNAKYLNDSNNRLIITKRLGLFKIYLTGKKPGKGLGKKRFGITPYDTELPTINFLNQIVKEGWFHQVIQFKENYIERK